MQISVLGLGWYGLPLARELLKDGHTIRGSTRTQEKKLQLAREHVDSVVLDYPDIPQASLLGAEIIVLNIPPFAGQLEWFESWPWDKKSWPVFISSTSTYPVPDSPAALLLSEQESWIKNHFSTWTILRFGGLIGAGRHPGKYLAGKKNLKGRLWPVNLIALNDAVGATKAVINNKIQHRTIEVVQNEHPCREEFYSAWCRKHHYPVPEFDPTDLSTGKVVPNDQLTTFYTPGVSLWSV